MGNIKDFFNKIPVYFGGLLIIFSLFLPSPIPPRASITAIQSHPQTFSLSCESRSAVDWAAYFGVKVKEKKFLRALPRSDNPDEGFVGNPKDPWGGIPPASYGVHATPVAKLLNRLGVPAVARKGISWREVRKEIASGRPVIVWVVGQMWKGQRVIYHLKDG
ncbi:MAG: C39 family peptidase, partial [Anaerolineales bacterium]